MSRAARHLLCPSLKSIAPGRHLSLSASCATESSSASSAKVPIALVAELRKHNPISLSKAREALSKSSNSVSAALEWLENDLASSGVRKAAKVGGRETKQGLIGVTVMGTRAAMVEVNCETDFVGRNEVFRNLVEGLCSTTAYLDVQPSSTASTAIDPISSFPIQELLEAPLVPLEPKANAHFTSSGSVPHLPAPQTISQAITSAITQTGENIQLRRAITFASPLFLDPATSADRPSSGSTSSSPFLLPGVYVHGSTTPSGNEGSVGGLVILSIRSTTGSSKGDVFKRISSGDSLGGELQKMARSVARQVVGFQTKDIRAPVTSSANGEAAEGASAGEGEVSQYLLEQPFMMFQGEERSVEQVLRTWGAERELELEVVAIRRWSVGDGME